METQQQIKTALAQALKAAYGMEMELDALQVEAPRSKEHGDFASNAAMQLARELKKNPRQIAQEIVSHMEKEPYGIAAVEIAGPGFLNFTMKKDAFSQIVGQILEQKEHYGTGSPKGIRVNLEYVSANPTGQLHLGHARGAAWGDAVSRIMKKAGYDVTREYYVNDAGNQVDHLAHSLYARYLQALGFEKEIGADGYLGRDVQAKGTELAQTIGNAYIEETPENLDFFKKTGIAFELEQIKKDLEAYRVPFDVWSSEQAIRDAGLVEKALKILEENGKTYRSQGALWFRTTDYGDDKDRVLQKSDGSYTYLVPDIAYHNTKYERGYDLMVDFLGADHHGYISRLKGSMAALGNDPDKLDVDIIQMVRLVHGGEEEKMSKRLGNATTIRELTDEVGVDAARYFFVSRALDTHLDFDMDLALSQSNDNPVYYAQYAHARMHSILKNAPGRKPALSHERLVHEKELDLLKVLAGFGKVVQDAAGTRQVHKVCHYIQNLASAFHSFYNACKVIDPEDPELSAQRLDLVEACKIVLAEALALIGVSAPDTM